MIHKLARRTVLSLALLGIGSMTAHAQTAASYPNRPVKLIVAFAAGGPIDLASRIVAEQLTHKLGQPVVVENKPGANGSIAAEYVKSQLADGHTLLISNASMITITPTLKKDLKYDVDKDFAPVTRLVTSPLILVVNPENPATTNIRSVAELVAAAKRAPGQLSYGSAGLNGNVQQLAFELLASESGVSFLPVPYKGSSEAQGALFSQTVALGFDTPTAIQHIRLGKLRPLAVTSKERLKELPDTPTMEELGYKGFEIGFWSGVFLPKATPPAIINRVSQAIIQIGQDSAVRSRLEMLGMVTIQTPEQFAAHIKTETNLLADVIKRSNIKVE